MKQTRRESLEDREMKRGRCGREITGINRSQVVFGDEGEGGKIYTTSKTDRMRCCETKGK